MLTEQLYTVALFEGKINPFFLQGVVLDVTVDIAKTPEMTNPVYTTTSEELETNKLFSAHITSDEIKNANIIGHFGFLFEKKITRLS